MLTRLYIEALLANEDLAEQIWDLGVYGKFRMIWQQ